MKDNDVEVFAKYRIFWCNNIIKNFKFNPDCYRDI